MATKTTELTVQETRELLQNPVYQELKRFEMQQRMAQMYVQSQIVPMQYRGNIGSCIIALDMAQRMNVNPLMVMQNLYVVNGNPAWSSKFLISCINMSGRFTPLRYQFVGKRGTMQYGCRAYAYEVTDKAHKEALCSVWITMDMAKKEGWMDKKGSKWMTMADQMLIYRAAAFWARAYAPEISMGFMTKEEAEDIKDAEFEIIDDTIITSKSEDIPEPKIDEQELNNAIKSSEETANTEDIDIADKTTTDKAEKTAADMVKEAMDKSKRTNYRAPKEVVDTETGEIQQEEEQKQSNPELDF